MSRILNITEFADVVTLATKFLLCGTIRGKVPYEAVERTREKNRRLGLGLMGMHEWLIQRGERYEVTDELHQWLHVYKTVSDATNRSFADHRSVSGPVANRAIAPTGSIGILAGTSTGVEPIFAVAYKRRYLRGSDRWHYQCVVDSAAQELIDRYGADTDKIESALDLAADLERRIKFQADVQDYVDSSNRRLSTCRHGAATSTMRTLSSRSRTCWHCTLTGSLVSLVMRMAAVGVSP